MGTLELSDFTELMEKQCNKLLLILSPQFIQSAECEFQTKFTLSLQIEERNRRLIPIVYKHCELPGFIRFLTKIDLSRGNLIPGWTWQKLISSLQNDNVRQDNRPPLPAINHSNLSSLSIHTLNSTNYKSQDCCLRYPNNPLGIQENVRNAIQNNSRVNSRPNSINSQVNSEEKRKEIPKIKVALEADYSPKMNGDKDSNGDRKEPVNRTTISTVTTQSFSGEDTQALIEKQKGFRLFSKLWKNISSKIK